MPNTAFVTAALICQHILEEKDGTLSVIRIADKYIAEPPSEVGTQENQLVPAIPINMLIVVRGTGPGPHSIGIKPILPSGTPLTQREVPIELSSPGHSHNLILRSVLGLVEGSGLYWFEVFLDKELCFRVPLQIEIAQPGEAQKV